MPARESRGIEGGDTDPSRQDLGAGGRGDGRPDRFRCGKRRLDEQVPAIDEPRKRVAQPEGGHIVEGHEVDPVELGVDADRRVGDGQEVGGREPLLLRSIARIRLDLLAEQLPDERRDQLVRRDAPEPADRVAAHRVRTGRPDIDRVRREGERVPDPEDADAIARLGPLREVVERGHEVPCPTSRDPSPATYERTRGTITPSAAASYRAARTSRVSGFAAASGSSVRSTTATARASPGLDQGGAREWATVSSTSRGRRGSGCPSLRRSSFGR